ncbi:MAG TPA: D-sedoheptulose 7-phosphate isomerase [Saprospiraceae bacterium]|nr:D-sedoheptulose 7-phosphate isomerase [Saprospiraceae bacterium]
MSKKIKQIITASIETKQKLLADESLVATLCDVVDQCLVTYRADGKLLFCGNGGSAADAQHIAAELSGRFYKDRPPLFAEALHVNGSYLTAVANDYGFEAVYARMVEAAGQAGDVLFAISTSGNSPNVLRAVVAAKKIGMKVVAMTGSSGGELKAEADFLLNVPSEDTPRVQECHILLGHIICELIELKYF